MKRTAPPGGAAPPAAFRVQAEEIARRHLERHPEDVERYGEHTMAWCVHDNQYILDWAAQPYVDFEKEIRWLAGILESRGYPLESLAENLETAAEVVPELATTLRRGAEIVRSLGS